MSEAILLGNEAIAYGILGAGASVVTSYPGTPASEILATVMKLAKDEHLDVHVEWSINEKTAFEIAFANSIAGRRSAVSMKQVGLNVASDSVISASYMGIKSGLVLVVADDPGPHSSQTEQDTRMFAMFAKVPVLDPSSPEEAMDMVQQAFELSEKYKTPVILRPTTRVCHARQGVRLPEIECSHTPPSFEKDPFRWAATPGPRLRLHKELNEKLDKIESDDIAMPRLILEGRGDLAVISSGVAYAYVRDIHAMGLARDISIYKIDMPYPVNKKYLDDILKRHKKVLVLEETEPVIELQFSSRQKVSGRLDMTVARAGELTPDNVRQILGSFTGMEEFKLPESPVQKRPSLCPGCAHRAAFFAIKRGAPKGIYTSDIGCYTLGLNLGSVDTCLCMGASISQACGFYHAYKGKDNRPPIVATIGDSTFFHAGIPATINAVVTGAKFVLVVLDNGTTAMTGNQPTPAVGSVANDFDGNNVSIEQVLKGCGVKTILIRDPYDVPGFTRTVKEARKKIEDEGVVAIIARHPCIRDKKVLASQDVYSISVTDRCNKCRYCIDEFECPALYLGESKVEVDMSICIGCGVCVHACPRRAIVAEPIKG